MKYKCPDFLLDVSNPFEGDKLLKDFAKGKVVIGIDEVGRGPLAGPVVACAAVLKDDADLSKLSALNDSKKLTRTKREAMYDDVKEACLCYAIASSSVAEIDEMNILAANFLAMRRALNAIGFNVNVKAPELDIDYAGTLPSTDVLIAVDGNLAIKEIAPEIQMPIVKGDGRVASISAASVLAKVFRDRLMDKYAETYPQYGFEVNAGYGTKKHLAAIKEFGYTPIHRTSFHPKSLQVEMEF